MKYCDKIVRLAADWVKEHGLIDYGGAQLQDFVRFLGIDDKTYRNWMKKDAFHTAIETAKEEFKRNLVHDLHQSLSMVAKGFEREETETEFKPSVNPDGKEAPKVVKMKRKKVYFQPNVGAAIFLLTNLDPEHYQNRQNSSIAIKPNGDKEMTLDEINAEIERLEKLDNK